MLYMRYQIVQIVLTQSQVRELYRDRVALEREYAAKLQALARKASEKKARMTTAFVLGDEPTKVWDESALRKR